MDAKGKTAIVTGGASGLGLGTCRALAAAGARIVAFDVDEDRLESLRTSLGDTEVVTQRVDVSKEEDVRAGIEAAVAAFGSIDIAVNCAGVGDAAKTISKGGPFPLAVWEKVININLTGTFNVIRLAAVEMAKNTTNDDGERGVIINTSSGAAWQGQMGQAAYSASKAGVMGLTLPMARDLAPYGIRVVSIAPGLFDTQMVAGLTEKVSQAIIDKMILFPHRMGSPDEFASFVRQIVENCYFNATTISLDAGSRMASR